MWENQDWNLALSLMNTFSMHAFVYSSLVKVIVVARVTGLGFVYLYLLKGEFISICKVWLILNK